MPFPVESSLSGVQRGVTPQEALWYETTFEVPAAWRRDNDVLLHFGAVDWCAEVYVNDLLVGSHTGGFTPFSFDITPALSAKGAQRLTVKVTDPTDKGFQPRGKQAAQAAWHLVHARDGHLADGVDRTGSRRQPHRGGDCAQRHPCRRPLRRGEDRPHRGRPRLA